MERRVVDYEDRLFIILDGASGFVFQSKTWRPIKPAFAGKVWASGCKPSEPRAKYYGTDMSDAPA